jgi:predicted ArsR family transcriptional regulator
MRETKLSERFFDSTRGRIVTLLRGTTGTVNELAAQLGLTDNAVRSHLFTLERDGLIRQTGLQKGTRKPHFAYELTPNAEQLFPKVYDALLNQLITVLKSKLAPAALKEALREVGRSLARGNSANNIAATRENRIQNALEALRSIGGLPRLEVDSDRVVIRSGACPLAAAVAEHPEVCEVAEALVEEILGTLVNERCDRSETPCCCFELFQAG